MSKYPRDGTVFFYLRIDTYGEVYVNSDVWDEPEFDQKQFDSGNFYLAQFQAEVAAAGLASHVNEFFRKDRQ